MCLRAAVSYLATSRERVQWQWGQASAKGCICTLPVCHIYQVNGSVSGQGGGVQGRPIQVVQEPPENPLLHIGDVDLTVGMGTTGNHDTYKGGLLVRP